MKKWQKDEIRKALGGVPHQGKVKITMTIEATFDPAELENPQSLFSEIACRTNILLGDKFSLCNKIVNSGSLDEWKETKKQIQASPRQRLTNTSGKTPKIARVK